MTQTEETSKPKAFTRAQFEQYWKGCVLATSEQNLYHDSYFHVTVWDEGRNEPRSWEYAATAWGSDPAAARVDATPEVRAAYDAYCARRAKQSRVSAALEARKVRFELARLFNVPASRIRRLEAAYGAIDTRHIVNPAGRYNRDQTALSLSYGFSRTENDFDRVSQLAKSHAQGKLRSEFRKKLAQQVIDWLNDPEPQYATPLSKKQLGYVPSRYDGERFARAKAGF